MALPHHRRRDVVGVRVVLGARAPRWRVLLARGAANGGRTFGTRTVHRGHPARPDAPTVQRAQPGTRVRRRCLHRVGPRRLVRQLRGPERLRRRAGRFLARAGHFRRRVGAVRRAGVGPRAAEPRRGARTAWRRRGGRQRSRPDRPRHRHRGGAARRARLLRRPSAVAGRHPHRLPRLGPPEHALGRHAAHRRARGRGRPGRGHRRRRGRGGVGVPAPVGRRRPPPLRLRCGRLLEPPQLRTRPGSIEPSRTTPNTACRSGSSTPAPTSSPDRATWWRSGSRTVPRSWWWRNSNGA